MIDLKQAFAETREQLDKIILAYRRGVPLPHPETLVWYRNDTLSSFNIEGELGRNSIPDKENAVKVEIGTTVTSIGTAIAECFSLSAVTIPNSVTTIRLGAFMGCSGLTSIMIPDSVTSIGDSAFGRCSGLSSIIIPDSMTNIGNSVFSFCSGLTSVTIPDSVTSIGSYAFNGCTALSSLTCKATTAPTVTQYTFGSTDSYYTGRNTYSSGDNVLKVPQGATGYNLSYWLDPLQNASKCGFHIEYI